MPEPIFFNFCVAAAIVLTLVYSVYVIHLMVDDASIIDLVWGAGFGLVAIGLLVLVSPKTNFNVRGRCFLSSVSTDFKRPRC